MFTFVTTTKIKLNQACLSVCLSVCHLCEAMVAILIGHEKWKLLVFLVCYCVPWTFSNWQLLLLALGCYEHTHLNYDDIKVYSGWTRSKSTTVMITQISVCETMYVIPDTALLSKGGGGWFHGGYDRQFGIFLKAGFPSLLVTMLQSGKRGCG